MIEVVCALAIIALLAAIILPSIPRQTSRARLEAFAAEAAGILKADHNSTVLRRTEVATQVLAGQRIIRAGSSRRELRLPRDVEIDALLAATCRGKEAGPVIQFHPSGGSCGGAIALSRAGMRYEVRVNWLTGGVDIVSQGG